MKSVKNIIVPIPLTTKTKFKISKIKVTHPERKKKKMINTMIGLCIELLPTTKVMKDLIMRMKGRTRSSPLFLLSFPKH